MSAYLPESYRSHSAIDLALNKPTALAETLQKSQDLYAGIPHNWLNKEIIEDVIREGDVDETTLNEAREAPMCFDHEYLKVPTFQKRRGLYFLLFTLSAVGRLCYTLLLPILLIVVVSMGCTTLSMGNGFWLGFIEGAKIMFLGFLLPGFIVDWGIKAIFKYFEPQLFGGLTTEYEFCRPSGLVKVFEPQTGAVKHCFPFAECVAETWAQVGHQGIVVRHPLSLRHYSNPEIKIDGGRIGADRTLYDTYATWDFIQRYMDVTSPLPDIPLLEYWRSQDATSRHYDEQSGRNPRYWRELSEDQIDSVLAQQEERNNELYRAHLTKLNLITLTAKHACSLADIRIQAKVE